MSTTDPMPSAEIVFDTLFAYQKAAALKTAIDLDLFTAIDEGARTAAVIATRTKVSDAAHGSCATILRSTGCSPSPTAPTNWYPSRPRASANGRPPISARLPIFSCAPSSRTTSRT